MRFGLKLVNEVLTIMSSIGGALSFNAFICYVGKLDSCVIVLCLCVWGDDKGEEYVT